MFRRIFAVQVLLAAVMVLAVCSFSSAADESSTITKTKSIAAFKNGLGFFLREGEAVLKDGWAVSEVVPAAALGTYWVGSPKSGVSIERLIATQDEETITVPAITVQEMLKSNIGKNVKITGSDGKTIIEGKIISVPDDRKPELDRPTYPVTTTLLPYSNASLVLIQTQTGTVAIEKHRIGQIEFEGPANTDFASKQVVKRFRFKVSGAKDKAPITIGYLQKGVSWSPAYLVELIDDKNARITMQGLLINDVEDIDGAEVYFVVGYPNFMFADTQSPLTLTQSIADFVQGLGAERSSNSIYSQSVEAYSGRTSDYSYAAKGPAGPAPAFGYSAGKETPGAQEEDLFLYHMKDVSLKKGERAYYTVFTADVPYEHVYEWNVPDTSNVQSSGYVSNSQQNDQKPVDEQVWHKLKLTNTSKFPWTTAPGMAMSKGQPLAQDMLSYTSMGAKGDLKLTVATDISAKKSESEKSREKASGEIYNNYNYLKVTSDGKLTIKNFKSKAVTVTVNKTLTGEVVSSSSGGTVDKTTEGIKAANPTSVITWEVPLKAGEEKILDYTYFTLIRL